MHFFNVRAPFARVAVLTCVVATQLATSGAESLLSGRAPIPAVAAAQSSSRSRSRKPPVRRTSRRTTRGRVAAPVASSAWTSPNGASALQSDLAGMISRNVRSGQFGAMVVSLTRGDTLFAQNAGEMMQPASTMKLFSTAVALDRFGPEHRFSTDVLRDGPVGGDGTVNGNIFLRADGDPSMSARFYKDPNLPMTTLARSVAAAGVKHVKGDLVYDASAFDDQKIPDGWKTTYLGAAYAARVSALSLNENLVWVVVQPNGKTANVHGHVPTA